jgi:hypothetical protein
MLQAWNFQHHSLQFRPSSGRTTSKPIIFLHQLIATLYLADCNTPRNPNFFIWVTLCFLCDRVVFLRLHEKHVLNRQSLFSVFISFLA